jgi:diguanylate cyclase (GGDEF)-like protein
VGTQLLNALGNLLKTTLRESDLIYRYGGDEFVMLIPDVQGETGKAIGERVLNAVNKEKFKIGVPSLDQSTTEFSLTVSIGVATFPQDAKNKEEILSIADKMMYEAKQTGRGRVCYTKEILAEASKVQEAK